jgi:MFS family permease
MDRVGPKRLLPFAAAVVGVGALMFAAGNQIAASAGRFLQGAGGVFALVGAIYIATQNSPASRAATLIGATQMFGIAGGSAGQFAVGVGSSMGAAMIAQALGASTKVVSNAAESSLEHHLGMTCHLVAGLRPGTVHRAMRLRGSQGMDRLFDRERRNTGAAKS